MSKPTTEPQAALLPMDPSIRIRLSVMMFLQYFTWGAFFVSMGTYLGKLGFTGERIGLAYGTSALGAIIAPFFVGMVADRFFATQRILATLHLVGAGLLYLVSQVTEFWPFYFVLLSYFVCYMPTLSLTNSLSFSHMTSPERQFPGVRVLGTIGWIAAGLMIGQLEYAEVNTALIVAAISSAVLGVYCWTLPHTPPPAKGKDVDVRAILGLDALGLMKTWSFAVFVIGSFLITIPLQFYYGFANQFLTDIGMSNATGKMTIGQMSEIFFMLVMPMFFARLGVKYMLLVGMVAWVARYVLFAYGNVDSAIWMLYLGIALHGICYDFFFVTGYIYVDQKAPESIRGQAQGFITLITLGVGGFIGTWLAGRTSDYFTIDGKHDWQQFWLAPAAMALVVAVIFAVTFFDRGEKKAA